MEADETAASARSLRILSDWGPTLCALPGAGALNVEKESSDFATASLLVIVRLGLVLDILTNRS